MRGPSATPSAQMWSLLRCSTSSTGSPGASVIAFRRAGHPREQRLVVRLAVVDRSQGRAAVPVAHARDEALLYLREKPDQAAATPLCTSGGTQRISNNKGPMEEGSSGLYSGLHA